MPANNYISVQLRPIAANGPDPSEGPQSVQFPFDDCDVESTRAAWDAAMNTGRAFQYMAVWRPPIVAGPWRRLPVIAAPLKVIRLEMAS